MVGDNGLWLRKLRPAAPWEFRDGTGGDPLATAQKRSIYSTDEDELNSYCVNDRNKGEWDGA